MRHTLLNKFGTASMLLLPHHRRWFQLLGPLCCAGGASCMATKGGSGLLRGKQGPAGTSSLGSAALPCGQCSSHPTGLTC